MNEQEGEINRRSIWEGGFNKRSVWEREIRLGEDDQQKIRFRGGNQQMIRLGGGDQQRRSVWEEEINKENPFLSKEKQSERRRKAPYFLGKHEMT